MNKWYAQLSDGTTKSGTTLDGSWRNMQQWISDSHLSIVSFYIQNETNRVNIDKGCSGYFLGNKTIAHIPQGSINLVGIGYWKSHSNMVRIKWCNSNTLELVSTEARPVESSKLFLVKNYGY